MKLFLFCFFISNLLFCQTNFPKDYFKSPLTIPMQLSGNFGELRPNHFHAGFDFKTMQQEGLGVYAIADGYVSRIKISPFGNGKTIYITHPNGYTSVYAHLQKAVGAIQDFIIKTHYKERAFEIEMFLKPEKLTIKQGQLIAYSGNTGASEGPHLHFEIRDSKTEHIINPMLFGFDTDLKDTKSPTVSGIYVYPLDAQTIVNKSKRPILLHFSLQKGGYFLSDKVVTNGRIGFGIIADDYDDVSFSKNGVYRVQSFFNGQFCFGYQFDTYSFDDMRYVNALIDYAKYKKTKQRVQKLFMKNKYGLPFIKTDEAKGIITPIPNLDGIYNIELTDFATNKTKISIPIQYNSGSAVIPANPTVSNYFVKSDRDCSFEKDNVSVFFPAGTFYEDFELNFEVKNNTLWLHEDTVPAHTNFTITMTASNLSKEEREKMFIAQIKGKKINFNPTYKKDTIFSTKVKTLGNYKLVRDTIAPKISITKPIEGLWMDTDRIELQISDTISGIKKYNGYLNGKWILFEYDYKTEKITHYFEDGIVVDGLNMLKVEVTDNVGNSAIFETQFFWGLKNK